MFHFIQAGGPFMWLLMATSLVALAFIIERSMALRWNRVVPKVVEGTIEECTTPSDLLVLQQICRQHPSPIGRLILTATNHLNWPKSENVDALQTRARKEVALLERGLVILEVVVGTAPLLGLLGTLQGLIILFGGLGQGGFVDSTSLAKGISIALNTTLVGLLIAIPALIAWSYFSRKVETLAIEMETICDELLQRFYSHEVEAPAPRRRRPRPRTTNPPKET